MAELTEKQQCGSGFDGATSRRQTGWDMICGGEQVEWSRRGDV